MKKLLFLLVFAPLVSFGQITFKDVMSISSLDQFKRVMIENNYESNESDNAGMIVYGLNIVKDSIGGDRSTSWGMYQKTGNGFIIQFSRENIIANFFGIDADTSENPYDLIVKDIKEKCKFYKILNYNDGESSYDYSCYSCPSSTYRGKIGFVVSEDFGFIKHFVAY